MSWLHRNISFLKSHHHCHHYEKRFALYESISRTYYCLCPAIFVYIFMCLNYPSFDIKTVTLKKQQNSRAPAFKHDVALVCVYTYVCICIRGKEHESQKSTNKNQYSLWRNIYILTYFISSHFISSFYGFARQSSQAHNNNLSRIPHSYKNRTTENTS